jgi:hypothetical protein
MAPPTRRGAWRRDGAEEREDGGDGRIAGRERVIVGARTHTRLRFSRFHAVRLRCDVVSSSSTPRVRVASLVLLLAGSHACSAGEIHDPGALRIVSRTPTADLSELEFEPFAPLEASAIGARLDRCETVEGLECTLEIDGTTLRFSAVVHTRHVPRLRCTPERLFVEAVCDPFTLPSGTFTVEYGDGRATLTIPSTGPEVVVDSDPDGG